MSDSLPVYLLDSDVLIQAHRMYYAFDICHGFWESLQHHHRENRLYSIAHVKDEIKGGLKDALFTWAYDTMPSSFFQKADNLDVLAAYSEIIRWVQSEKFTEAAKEEFAKSADGWIIAFSKAKNYSVVTCETYEKDRRNKVKIPNVCLQFNVPCIDTFTLLRDLKTQFSWKKP